MLVSIANWLGSHISTALLISPYIHFFYYTTSTFKGIIVTAEQGKKDVMSLKPHPSSN